MPHYFDFQSVEEHAFVLQNLAMSSKQYGYRHGAGYLFQSRLEPLASRYTIQIATTTRMIEDTLSGLDYGKLGFEYDSDEMDDRIRGDYVIGEFRNQGSADLRTTLNKIIHAERVDFLYSEDKRNGNEFEYWTGTMKFEGTYHGEEWYLSLFTERWCSVILHFYEIVQSEVEWQEIYTS